MIILTGEHKEKYLEMLKNSYDGNIKLIESIENNKDNSNEINEETLNEIKANCEEIKQQYELSKNLEQIELYTNYKASENNNYSWIWLMAVVSLFGFDFSSKNKNKDNSNNFN